MIQATAEVSLEDIMLREIRPSQKMNTWESPQKKHLEESNTRQKAQQRLAGTCRMGHEASVFTRWWQSVWEGDSVLERHGNSGQAAVCTMVAREGLYCVCLGTIRKIP